MGACALLIVACGGGGEDDDGNLEIAKGPLTGKVGGASWTIAGARARASLSRDDSFWVDMYGVGTMTCQEAPEGNSLIVTAPKKIGTYQFNLNLNSTFVIHTQDETDNWATTNGVIRIDEVTATTLRGGLNMTYNASNSVNGEFQATICP